MGGEAVTEQEKIENCYRQMYDGIVRKDGRLLSEVLDDSFVLIHITGMRQSKEVFIRSVEDGTLNYYSTAHQEIKTEIHGETATLHGKSIVNAAVFGGSRHINYWLADNCFGDYYTRTGLDYKQREMITFCFLAAQGGCEPQLTSHAAANMKIGNDKVFLIKIISQCLPYIGYPRSLNALRCVNDAAKQ